MTGTGTELGTGLGDTVGLPPTKTPEEQDKELRELIGSRWWFFKVLNTDKSWNYLVPWPIPVLVQRWRQSRGRKAKGKLAEDGRWSTLAILLTIYMWSFTGSETVVHDQSRASDAGKILFTGAFLLGTLLSVSITLPGQSVLKPLITKKPSVITNFAAAFAWSLLWGLSGGALLTFYGDWYPEIRPVAIFVGILGGFAELNTLLFVFRLYLMGLADISRDARVEAAKKKGDKGSTST
ncbi:hypothetical protein [Corallococcus sp. 4LFB]|uniref:hypothetical protein n=1 Tax=Corallococcus sp. 4LFB TaxID=3383249 RepID=UPI0039760DF3